MKNTDSLAADDLIEAANIIFTEFGLLMNFVSDAGRNLCQICSNSLAGKMNIEQAITPSYNNQSISQGEACIKFIKCTIKKFLDTINDMSLALLQIRSVPNVQACSVLPHCYSMGY